ncbi:MAG: hypothetical protein COA84_13010 [Robiginitomaculum sp.]|nr:MAG: hypothetical protein COA84_13010 [Robiginitomaculum sp.]
MPLYEFKNNDTNQDESHFFTITERKNFLLENPHITQRLASPPYGDSVRLGIRKIDNSFNDVLLKAKGAHLHSTIETK